MARGWESKSVEAQQAEAVEQKQLPRVRMTPDQAARQRQLEGLRLSRQLVMQRLTVVQDPRHRQILDRALSDLDREIRDLLR